MQVEEINELCQCFVKALNPLKVYLFGSFAYGTPNENSDYDFYIIVSDDFSTRQVTDLYNVAYKSIREKQKRPVDILISNNSDFEKKKDTWPIEYTVSRKGKLIYSKNIYTAA